MNIKGRPISHLAGRLTVALANRGEQMRTRLAARFPTLLGLPFLGPYAQLYRHDEMFTTELSVFNYLSVFLPDIEHKMTYTVVAYARNGARIGEGKLQLAHGAMAQVNLQEIIPAPLDTHGLFHVQADTASARTDVTAGIGETAGQFMTLYYARDGKAQAPQLIHSHKLFQRVPILRSPTVRHPAIVEHLAGVSRLQFYFLNTNPLRLSATLKVIDAETGKFIEKKTLSVPGHGVSELVLGHEIIRNWPKAVCFEYGFDRQVSHRKPILFRYFDNDSVATCNHT